jgi:hypothetical protein
LIYVEGRNPSPRKLATFENWNRYPCGTLAATRPNPKSAQTVLWVACKCRGPSSAALAARAAFEAIRADGVVRTCPAPRLRRRRASPDRPRPRYRQEVDAIAHDASQAQGMVSPPVDERVRRESPLKFAAITLFGRTARRVSPSRQGRPGPVASGPAQLPGATQWPSSKHGTWSNGLGP